MGSIGYHGTPGFLSKDVGDVAHYASNADSELFRAIIMWQPQHVLANLFPQHKNTGRNLRSRVHSYTFPIKDENNFSPRIYMLYININLFTFELLDW